MTDRPEELDDLLAYLAEVMPPLTEEEEAVFDRWRAEHGGNVGPVAKTEGGEKGMTQKGTDK